MARKRTALQKAAGKLIFAIQKEWGEDLGGPHAEFSEDVMDRAHDLLQAGTSEEVRKILDPRTVCQYVGEVWLQGHPNVKQFVAAFEELLEDDQNFNIG
ncbi:hypothetical protein [Thiolapillus sp.]